EQRKLLSKPNTQAFLEKRYIHKDGHTFWVQVCVSTFAGSNGKNKYFVALVQDIDERVKAQDTVKQIEENFRILAESIPQIVWVQDNNGYVIYLNQQWTDYTGRSIEDSLGLKWLNVMHPDDRKTIIANIDLNDAKDEDDDPPWREAVQRFRMADGSYRWFLARAVPVRNEQGDNIRWLGTSTDIDTHKKIEMELDEARMLAISASESKGAFLANMSHEIRTPLGIILGYCELLKRPGITPELQNDFLLAMTRNGHELSQLIDNILDLSKMEAEKLDLALMKFDVESQIKGIIDDLRMKAQEKNLSISLNFADSVPKTIIIDELRLRQILINIVGNAIKFTDQGQIKVELQMLSTDRLLAIDVTDTGDGIDSHQIERLFKAFSQVDATSTRRHGGTGLGLMLSRMLANVLGGDVILLHSTLGQGSCFRITINPYFELETLPRGPIEVSHRKEFEPRKALDGLQILLAEDAPDNQFIFSSFLRDEGADVDIAENGKQAVLKGLSKIYDLILMDIQMPIMDGYDATRHLRAGGYKGPVIALSAHALAEDSDKSKLAGCDAHITKPVDFDRLVKVIEQFTSRS
ncbi:MAG: PAS domain S-box protein, partial [Bdellovibrionota bacterium]